MSKILECAKIDPEAGCNFVARGETEEEVFRQVEQHAQEHGIRQVTPELMERVRKNIHEG